MIDRHGTAGQQAQLERIASRRNSLGMLLGLCTPVFLVLGYFVEKRHSLLGTAISVLAAVIGLGLLVYLSFFLRCPRCSSWIAIPKCPSCGLKLDKPAEQP